MNFLLELMCAVILTRAVATGSWLANRAGLTCASGGAAVSVFKRLFDGIRSSSASRMRLSADSGGRLLKREDMIGCDLALRGSSFHSSTPSSARYAPRATVGASGACTFGVTVVLRPSRSV